MLLIVKAGRTVEPLREAGDFEAWICDGMGVGSGRAAVCDVFDGAELPDPHAPSGIVVTGSAAMVSDREPWSERSAAWLRRAIEAGVPTLGICYGHQLIAHAFGGRVEPNPRGRQIGTVTFRPAPEARDDALLGAFAAPFEVHVTHVESVVALPDGVRSLGSTPGDPNAAFSIGSAHCVQFHPEFDAAILCAYLRERRDALAAEGIDVDERIAAVRECPAGPAILRRFARLCGS